MAQTPSSFRVHPPTLRVHLTSWALHRNVTWIDDVLEGSHCPGAITLAEHVWLAGGNMCERLLFRRGGNRGTVPTQRRSSFSHWVSWRVFALILLSELEAECGELTCDSFKYRFLICNKNTDILTLNSAENTRTNGYGPRYVDSSENGLLSMTPCLLTFLSMANHFAKYGPGPC